MLIHRSCLLKILISGLVAASLLALEGGMEAGFHVPSQKQELASSLHSTRWLTDVMTNHEVHESPLTDLGYHGS
jgi:hypothetical protein